MCIFPGDPKKNTQLANHLLNCRCHVKIILIHINRFSVFLLSFFKEYKTFIDLEKL